MAGVSNVVSLDGTKDEGAKTKATAIKDSRLMKDDVFSPRNSNT